MADAQNNSNPTHSVSDYADYSSRLRRTYRDYDRWTLNDVATRLNPLITSDMITFMNERANWHVLIPQSIRNQYGENAPRLFMTKVYERMESLRNYDQPVVANLRTDIARVLNIPVEESFNLVLDRPMDMVLTNGQTVRITPGQALMHRISRQVNDPNLRDILTPPPADQPFLGTLGGIIAIPDSTLDALKAANPRYADRLETLRGRPVVVVNPQVAYLAGQVGQFRGTNNITDWSVNVSDPAQICPNIPVIERALANMTPRDVRVDEAFLAGAVRASDACPITLGSITPPRVPANDAGVAPRLPTTTFAAR